MNASHIQLEKHRDDAARPRCLPQMQRSCLSVRWYVNMKFMQFKLQTCPD